MIRCPECRSPSIIKRKRVAIFECNVCKFNFTETESVAKDLAERNQVEARAEVKRTSGQVCRPRIYEWKPLKRSPFEHAELAMLARRG